MLIKKIFKLLPEIPHETEKANEKYSIKMKI